MKNYGFEVSASCAGQAWYAKSIDYEGRRAYITVTDKQGKGLPQSVGEPISVTIYDLSSGDELEDSKKMNSLESFLASLGETEAKEHK
jgi:hypothetical protein